MPILLAMWFKHSSLLKDTSQPYGRSSQRCLYVRESPLRALSFSGNTTQCRETGVSVGAQSLPADAVMLDDVCQVYSAHEVIVVAEQR